MRTDRLREMVDALRRFNGESDPPAVIREAEADLDAVDAAREVLRVLLTTHPSSKRARIARERARALLGMGAPATPEKKAKVEVRQGQEWTKDVTTVRITTQPYGGRVVVATVTKDGRLIRRRSTFVKAFTNTPAGYRLTKDAPEVTS